MTASAAPPKPPAAPLPADPPQGMPDRYHEIMGRALARANALVAYGSIVVSIMILLGFYAAIGVLLFKPFQMTDNFERLLNVILGALVAAHTQVANYWLGSSAGSARKDQMTPAPAAQPAPAATGGKP